MMKRSKWLVGITMLVLAAIVLSACGKTSTTTTSGTTSAATSAATTKTTTTATTTATTAAKSIKVGILHDLSGPAGVYGKNEADGAMLAIEQANAAGGINGRKIEAVQFDSATDPQQAVAGLRKLASDSDVIAVHGATTSNGVQVTAPVAKELGIAMFGPSSATKFPAGVLNEWTFRGAAIQGNMIESYLKGLKAKLNFNTMAVVTDVGAAFAVAETEDLRNFQTSVGYKIVDIEGSKAGDTDFTSAITKIAPLKPDVIWFGILVNEASNFMRQARERGVTAKFIGGSQISDDKLATLAGPAGESLVTWFPYIAGSSMPEQQKFEAAFKQRFNRDAGNISALGYDAMNVLITAMKNAKTLDRIGVRDAINQVKGYQGVVGSYTYGNGPDNLTPGYNIVQIVNGKFVPFK